MTKYSETTAVPTEASKKETKEKEETIKRLKVQINNINIVGKIITEEANIINEFIKNKKIIVSEQQQDRKKQLQNIVVALGVAASYFTGKVDGLEKQVKKLTDEKSDK